MYEENDYYPDVFHSLPRNDEDFQGGYVLYSTTENVFYLLEFGTGDNLSHEDLKNGYDDYMMLYAFKNTSWRPLLWIFRQIQEGDPLEEFENLEMEEIDGSQMLIKREDYDNTGDARAYIQNALDMLGYGKGLDERSMYCDLVFVRKI